MPLDVTAGPAAKGNGPPSAGLSDPGPPRAGLAVLFSALLAQQTQLAPAFLARTPSAPLPTIRETPDTKDSDGEAVDPQTPVAQEPLDPAPTDWAMLSALLAPPPALIQTALPAGDTPTVDAPTIRKETIRKEVMDTASLSVPTAFMARTDATIGELLPLHTMAPQTQGAALSLGSIPSNAEAGASQAAESPESEALVKTPAGVVPPLAAPPLPSIPYQVTALADPPAVQAAASPPPSAEVAPIVPGPKVPTALVSRDGMIPESDLLSAAVAQGQPNSILIVNIPVGTSEPVQKPVLARGIPKAVIVASPASPTAFFARPTSLVEITSPMPLQNVAVPANNTSMPELHQSDAPPAQNAALAPANEVTPIASPIVKPAMDTRAVAPHADEGAKGPERLPAQGVVPEGTRRSETSNDVEPVRPKNSEEDASGQEKTAPSAPEIQSIPTQRAETGSSVAPITQKSLTGAERAQVVRQITDGVGLLRPHVVANGHGQMTVNLHPKEWGDLRVTVQLTPTQPIDGMKQTTVTAHVVASSAAVKAALETHTDDLNRALRQTGLHLERLTVAVQAASASGQSGTATGEGRNSDRTDQWQAAQTQTSAGNGGFGNGGASSTPFSGQGGSGFQSRSGSRSGYQGADDAGADLPPVSGRILRQNAGFDQRV